MVSLAVGLAGVNDAIKGADRNINSYYATKNAINDDYRARGLQAENADTMPGLQPSNVSLAPGSDLLPNIPTFKPGAPGAPGGMPAPTPGLKAPIVPYVKRPRRNAPVPVGLDPGPANVAGTMGTPGIPQIDPEQSRMGGLANTLSGNNPTDAIKDRMHALETALKSPSADGPAANGPARLYGWLFDGATMRASRAERVAVAKFFGSRSTHALFMQQPELLAQAEKDPIAFAKKYGGELAQSNTDTKADRSGLDAKQAMTKAAGHLGLTPLEIASFISYETAGTFDLWKKGVSGKHFGLAQWGPEERRKYGLNETSGWEDQMNALVEFAVDRGFKPGEHGLDELYTTVNAGNPYAGNVADRGGDKNNPRMDDKLYGKTGIRGAGHVNKGRKILGLTAGEDESALDMDPHVRLMRRDKNGVVSKAVKDYFDKYDGDVDGAGAEVRSLIDDTTAKRNIANRQIQQWKRQQQVLKSNFDAARKWGNVAAMTAATKESNTLDTQINETETNYTSFLTNAKKAINSLLIAQATATMGLTGDYSQMQQVFTHMTGLPTTFEPQPDGTVQMTTRSENGELKTGIITPEQIVSSTRKMQKDYRVANEAGQMASAIAERKARYKLMEKVITRDGGIMEAKINAQSKLMGGKGHKLDDGGILFIPNSRNSGEVPVKFTTVVGVDGLPTLKATELPWDRIQTTAGLKT